MVVERCERTDLPTDVPGRRVLCPLRSRTGVHGRLASPARGDGTAAVERLVGQRALVSRANAAVLVLAVVLLAVAPAAGAAVVSLGRGFDPSADGNTLARARMSSGTIEVVIAPPAPDSAVPVSPADAPALDGNLLAYADSQGIKVIDWRTNHRSRRSTAPFPTRLSTGRTSPTCVTTAPHERLILEDLLSSQVRRVASVSAADDLGRPSLAGGRLAWHRIRHRGSAVFVLNIGAWTRRAIVRTNIWMESNPSLTGTRIVWVEQRPAGSYLRLRRFGSSRTRTLTHVKGRKTFLWTTALTGRTAYVTKWTPSAGRSALLRVTF